MRALFVTNQLKTQFYHALASRMRALGVPVSWISVSERWTDYLKAEGWRDDDILSLPRFGAEWSRPWTVGAQDIARLARIEATAEVGLKNILVMDRELSKKPSAETEGYISVVTREIERFVLEKGVTHGFGEPTWAPEMITSEVLRAHGRSYYMHHPVRIPSSRVGFYEGIFHDTLVEFAPAGDTSRTIAQEAIAAVCERGQRPYYFARNMNPHRFKRHWLNEASVAIARGGEARHDHSVPGLLTRSRRRIVARRRAAQVQRSGMFIAPPANASRPFVLILLHKQPEASVDVFGGALSNQLEVIRALARVLPYEFEIWVKEHAHSLGDRALSYYRDLACIPGVRLIDPNADTFGLIPRAALTASVAGTACMEAGVMGYPAITFGRVFFAPLLVSDGVNPFAMTRAGMSALLERGRCWRDDPQRQARTLDFITGCVAQSGEGRIGDPVSDPTCIEPSNIERVAQLTVELMRATAAPGSSQKGRAR